MRVGEILRLPNTDSILGRGEGRVGCLYREHRSVGDRRFSDGVGSTFVESYTSALFKKSFHVMMMSVIFRDKFNDGN